MQPRAPIWGTNPPPLRLSDDKHRISKRSQETVMSTRAKIVLAVLVIPAIVAGVYLIDLDQIEEVRDHTIDASSAPGLAA